MRFAQFRFCLLSSVFCLLPLAGCAKDASGNGGWFPSEPGKSWVDHKPTATEQGLALHQEGRYAEAAGCFRNAIREDTRDYKAHYYLGVAYDAQPNMGQEAIKSYKSCLDVMTRTYAGQEDKPFRVRCMDALAISIGKNQGKAIEIEKLEKEAATAARPAEVYFVLAKTYRFAGDPESALEYYNRASLQDNKNFLLLKEYGLYLEQLTQAQQSGIILRQAYALDDKDKEVLAALRRMGIIPGPSLKEQTDLARPLIPRGPLPEVNLSGWKSGPSNPAKPAATPPPAPAPSVAPFPTDAAQAPRD